MARFAGRTMIVTGGASGIGRACVARLFAEGANVAAVDLDERQVRAVVDELGGHERLLAAGVDIADAGRVADLPADGGSTAGTNSAGEQADDAIA